MEAVFGKQQPRPEGRGMKPFASNRRCSLLKITEKATAFSAFLFGLALNLIVGYTQSIYYVINLVRIFQNGLETAA
jgi:hypothetical protein